jgi:hypothetical protein
MGGRVYSEDYISIQVPGTVRDVRIPSIVSSGPSSPYSHRNSVST